LKWRWPTPALLKGNLVAAYYSDSNRRKQERLKILLGVKLPKMEGHKVKEHTLPLTKHCLRLGIRGSQEVRGLEELKEMEMQQI